MDSTEWALTFNVNVVAAAALSFAVLPVMVERGWGRIVNVSSAIAAHPGTMVGMNAYAASKAALEAHTVNLAAELAGSGVTVNAFRPGSVDTAMQEGIRARTQCGSAPPCTSGSSAPCRGRHDHPRTVSSDFDPASVRRWHRRGLGGVRPDYNR